MSGSDLEPNGSLQEVPVGSIIESYVQGGIGGALSCFPGANAFRFTTDFTGPKSFKSTVRLIGGSCRVGWKGVG